MELTRSPVVKYIIPLSEIVSLQLKEVTQTVGMAQSDVHSQIEVIGDIEYCASMGFDGVTIEDVNSIPSIQCVGSSSLLANAANNFEVVPRYAGNLELFWGARIDALPSRV